MSILERVKFVGRLIRNVVRIIVYSVGTLVLMAGLVLWGYSTYFMLPPNPLEVAKQHELQVQTNELEHRVRVCGGQIDNMIIGATEGADLHCALMWMQLKKLQKFVGELHISDPNILPLVEATTRTANRYAEYQTMISHPHYKPSSDSQSSETESESLQIPQAAEPTQPAQLAKSTP